MNYTEEHIDLLLETFGKTSAPDGLAQRVSARVAQADTDRYGKSPLRYGFPPVNLRAYALATAMIAVTAASYLLVRPHNATHRIAQEQPPLALPQLKSAPTVSTTWLLPSKAATRSSAVGMELSQVGPDAIAREETLAPSHPAPPLPLTAQEALLLRSTRPGQPIEVAEMDVLRESTLSSIADARERASLRQTIEGLLGPLATAKAMTSDSNNTSDSTPRADAGSLNP